MSQYPSITEAALIPTCGNRGCGRAECIPTTTTTTTTLTNGDYVTDWTATPSPMVADGTDAEYIVSDDSTDDLATVTAVAAQYTDSTDDLDIVAVNARDESYAAAQATLETLPASVLATMVRRAQDDVRALTASNTSLNVTLDDVRADSNTYAERAQRYSEMFDRAQRNHRTDIATIGAALISEAETRGWCSEYDDLIDDLNSNLSVAIAPRMSEYTVTATFMVSVSTTVTARDESDALDRAQDEINTIERDIERTDGVGYVSDDGQWEAELTD